MGQYPPNDLSAVRAEAAAALLASLREVQDVLDRLQFAAAWVLEAYGDTTDAETVRMLRIPGGPDRPGRPAVPPPAARSEHSTDAPEPTEAAIVELTPGHTWVAAVRRAFTSGSSVTHDETPGGEP